MGKGAVTLLVAVVVWSGTGAGMASSSFVAGFDKDLGALDAIGGHGAMGRDVVVVLVAVVILSGAEVVVAGSFVAGVVERFPQLEVNDGLMLENKEEA